MQSWRALPELAIERESPVARAFRERGCSTLPEAGHYVRELPYGRNTDRADFHLVLPEGRGTCSTKHALLAALGAELDAELELMIGIYEMSEANTPGVGSVLSRHGLSFVPEAHTYLRYRGTRIDVTRAGVGTPADTGQGGDRMRFLREIQIEPPQIGSFKVELHRAFLAEWLAERRGGLGLDLEALWCIREECIAALTQ